MDTAPESLLVTLPGIGPALARRIVQDRDRAGAFGSITALTRVAGIGEKTAARLAPRVTFSGAPRHPR
jgi:competence protein ComEA